MPPLKIEKQEAFARAYALHKNASRAAIEAGYSERGAGVAGSRLMARPEIKSRVSELIRESVKRVETAITADRAWVLNELIENAKDAREAKDRSAANRALELVGKELGMFVERKMDVTDPLAALSAEQLGALVRLADQLGDGPAEILIPPVGKSVIYPQPTDIIELSASSGAAEADPAPEPAPQPINEDDVI